MTDPEAQLPAFSRYLDSLVARALNAEDREAWRARRAGDADVPFPAGTYLMRVVHVVSCAQPRGTVMGRGR